MRVRALFQDHSVESIVPLDEEARDLLADEALAELAVQDANRRLAEGGVTVDELRDEEAGADEWTPLAAILLENARKMHT